MALELHYNVYGCFREPRSDIDLAKAAVDAGFEGIWIGDHFLPWIDSRPYTHHVFPWFGTLMSEIPDVPVGTSVTCPMLRYRPPLLAQAIATLDNMYPGRFNLGVGVGEALNEAHFEEYPDWDTRAEMMIESLELMDKLWSSDRYIRHQGDYFEYDNIKLYTQAKEPTPIHWAGWGPKSCYYAGKYADNLITVAPANLIENRIVPNYERGLEETGRSLSDVDITTEMSANIGNPDELTTEIRDIGEYIPSDTEMENSDPRSIQRVADTRLKEMSDEEVQDVQNITENPDDLIDELRQLEEAGATRVLIGSNCGDPYHTLEVFENHILPEFE